MHKSEKSPSEIKRFSEIKVGVKAENIKNHKGDKYNSDDHIGHLKFRLYTTQNKIGFI